MKTLSGLMLALLPLIHGCQLTQSQLNQMNTEISGQIETLRGWKFKKPVACRVTDVPHMIKTIHAEMKRDFPNNELQHKEAALKLMGVLPKQSNIEKDTLRFVKTGVAGFYIPREKTLYVRKDFSNFIRRIVLAHELVHALDDQYLDLQAIMDQTRNEEDAGFAVSSVFEGSARDLERQFMQDEMQRIGFFGQLGTMMEMLPMLVGEMINPWSQSNQMATMPRYYLTALARYSRGTRFLNAGIQKRGQSAQELLKVLSGNMPLSAEQILHPHKYWNQDKPDVPIQIHDETVEKVLTQSGLKTIAKDTMGELLCALVTSEGYHGLSFEQMLDEGEAGQNPWTNDAAAGWGGDRFYLVDTGGQQPHTAGVWITTWDRPSDRKEFDSAFANHRPDIVSKAGVYELDDRTTVYTFGLDKSFGDEIHKQIKTAKILNR